MIFFFSAWLPLGLSAAWLIHWKVLRDEARREYFLIAVSVGVLAYLQPSIALALLPVSVGAFTLSRAAKGQRRVFWGGILFFLAILVFARSGRTREAGLLPILGISYLVFRSIQYFFDSYRGLIKEHSYVKFLHFLCFFPTFLAGPIETYQGFHSKKLRELDLLLAGWGGRRMLWGYFKKLVVLEYGFAKISVYWNLYPYYALSSSKLAFPFLAKMFFYAYIDISAYSDIAIGMSALFGYRIMENFDNPVFNLNLSQFWQSWHLSIVNWSRNQVYYPIFSATKRPYFALYCCMIMIGIWHQFGLNWLIWAFYHATGLTLLSYWRRYKRRRPPLKAVIDSLGFRPICYALTLAVVILAQAWTLPNIKEGAQLFRLALSGLVGRHLS